MNTSGTSECDKMRSVREKSQACGEFLEWLLRRYTLAEWHYHDEGCRDDDGRLRGCGLSENELFPVHIQIEKLLAEFFEIDLAKVEDERRYILEGLRARREM